VAARRDFWLIDGAAAYYALKAVSELAQGTGFDQLMRRVYHRYNDLRLSYHERYSIAPERSYSFLDPGLDYFRRLQGAVLAHQLDLEIQGATHGQRALADYLRSAFRQTTPIDLLEDLNAHCEADLASFFDRLVRVERPVEIPFPREEPITQWRARVKQKPRFLRDETPDQVADTLTLVLTGDTESYLETCGCVLNQSGGVGRRATAIEQVRGARRHVVVVDAGNTFPDPKDTPDVDEVTEGEIRVYLRSLEIMGYDVAAVAENEIYHISVFRRLANDNLAFPFLTANAFHRGRKPGESSSTVTRGPHTLRFIGIYEDQTEILKRTLCDDRSEGWSFTDPVEALRTELAGERDPARQITITVGRLATPTIASVIEKAPELDALVMLGYRSGTRQLLNGEPTSIYGEPDGFVGNTLLLTSDGQVYGIHIVDLFLDEQGRILGFHKSCVLLNDSVENHPMVRTELESFYDSVAANFIDGQIEPLFAWDPSNAQRDYVGSGQCTSCHDDQTRQWSGTRHAQAFDSLLKAHRHFYPTCVKCHVAGLGWSTGYRIGTGESGLAHVTCEVCHGPGSDHVARPDQETIRRVPSLHVCIECHHPDHDDDFDYRRDYALVAH